MTAKSEINFYMNLEDVVCRKANYHGDYKPNGGDEDWDF